MPAGKWVLVGVLWVAFCLNFADRQVVFSIFPVLRSELGFSDVQLGLTGSLFLWVYALASPVAGRVGDRHSKRALVLTSLVLWSASTVLTGAAQSPGFLLACRALIGLTESLFYPASVALIASAHGATRSRALALFNSGSVIGVMVGGSYGGYVAEHYHWRWAFYSLGIAGILYAAPMAAALRGMGRAAASSTTQTTLRAALQFLRKPTFIVLCVVYTAETFITYLLYTWLATFLTEKFGLGLADAGFTATVYFKTGGVTGLVIGGWLADRLAVRTRGARLLVLAIAVLLSGPAAAAIAGAPSVTLIRVAAFAFGICNGAYMANLFASAFEVVAPECRASAAGALNLVGASISGFASLLGGVAKQSIGLEGAMIVSGALCVGAGVALMHAVRRWFPADQIVETGDATA